MSCCFAFLQRFLKRKTKTRKQVTTGLQSKGVVLELKAQESATTLASKLSNTSIEGPVTSQPPTDAGLKDDLAPFISYFSNRYVVFNLD